MELKKKKNLEPLKGIPFAALQIDDFNQISSVVDIRIGMDKENSKIINNLINSNNEIYARFVGENPEVLLPTDLDVNNDLGSNLAENQEEFVDMRTPAEYVKHLGASTWVELVKRWGSRSKKGK
jgi:hypothetical protein